MKRAISLAEKQEDICTCSHHGNVRVPIQVEVADCDGGRIKANRIFLESAKGAVAVAQKHVYCAASTTDYDTPSSFSNYGADVWVAAPGEGIVSTYPYGTYAAGWGTSFSAPLVSGTAALLVNVSANVNQQSAAAAIAHAVWISSDMGNGRLDTYQAVQAWLAVQ